MALILILIYCVCPMFGLLLTLFLYFYDKNKKGVIYSIIIGISFGLLAYYFEPLSTYDLVRHHNTVYHFMNLYYNSIFDVVNLSNIELIPTLYSLIISRIGNVDLLQFFVISIGYSIMFYILYDYRKITNISVLNFIVVVCFLIFGFHVLYFFSGLYCYIAYIIFSFGLYLDYVKKTSKTLKYTLYIAALLTHTSVFLPITILVIYKLYKDKMNYKLIIVGVLLYLNLGLIISFLHSNFNLTIIDEVYLMFYAYTTRNEKFIEFYTGYSFLIELTKIFIINLIILLQIKLKKINKGIYGFIVFFTIITLLMIIVARVSVRYIMIIQIIGIIPIMDYFSTNKKKNIWIFILFSLIVVIFGGYFAHLLFNMNFGDLFVNKFYRDIFTIFNK